MSTHDPKRHSRVHKIGGVEAENQAIDDLDLMKGGVDSSGNKIRFIYSKVPGKYVIYETTTHEVKVKGGNVSLSHQTKINKLLSEIADLTTNYPPLKLKYNSSLAHAMKLLMDDDSEASSISLQRTFSDMRRYLSRRAKFAYLSGALILMLASVCIFLIAYKIGIQNQLIARIFYAVTFSSMGGFMSVAIGLKNLKIDLQDGHGINVGYGAIRVLISIISGVFVFFLIESGVLLPFLKDTSDKYGFIIAAFISGFSETLVPNLLSKIEETRERDK